MRDLWEIIVEDCVDVAVAKLNAKIIKVLDRVAPVRTIVIKNRKKPWVNHDIKADLLYRKVLHEAAQGSNDPQDWRDYKMFRNRLRNKMRRTEEKFTKEWLNDDDESKKWSRIKDYAGLDKFSNAETLGSPSRDQFSPNS